MEATYSSEMPVGFHQTTYRYIPEDRTVHNHRCENLNPTENSSVFHEIPLFDIAPNHLNSFHIHTDITIQSFSLLRSLLFLSEDADSYTKRFIINNTTEINDFMKQIPS
jgi:hypothetical protein